MDPLLQIILSLVAVVGALAGAVVWIVKKIGDNKGDNKKELCYPVCPAVDIHTKALAELRDFHRDAALTRTHIVQGTREQNERLDRILMTGIQTVERLDRLIRIGKQPD